VNSIFYNFHLYNLHFHQFDYNNDKQRGLRTKQKNKEKYTNISFHMVIIQCD
jgi:hypothetical protein